MSGPYRALWLRDTLYCAIAREYVGDFESIKKTYGLAFDIFHKSGDKISSCIDDPPTAKTDFLHARYNPHTLQEFPEEWGHNQLDIFGLFLYKVGDLRQKGDRRLPRLQGPEAGPGPRLVSLLAGLGQGPDFGVWEEGPEVHASSVGAVLAGLRAAREHIAEIRVPGRFLAAGREALGRLLPRESESRPYDLAQLSLLWPYRVVSPEQREQILSNIETHLVRERGSSATPGTVTTTPIRAAPTEMKRPGRWASRGSRSCTPRSPRKTSPRDAVPTSSRHSRKHTTTSRGPSQPWWTEGRSPSSTWATNRIEHAAHLGAGDVHCGRPIPGKPQAFPGPRRNGKCGRGNGEGRRGLKTVLKIVNFKLKIFNFQCPANDLAPTSSAPARQ